MNRADVTFPSGESECGAWHYPGAGEDFGSPDGRPCVVLAHGFGATRDCGLDAFASAFAAAGLDALAFDYRGFADSGGAARQTVSITGQLADYAAAIDAARRLPGVDPQRIVLWGVSLSGGHVLAAGARDPAVAAVIALTPMVDGLAAARLAARHHPPRVLARSGVETARARLTNRRLPIVGKPGEPSALSLPGQLEAYTAMAGPSWRNEVDAGAALEITRYRPARHASRLRCPLLVQIADLDRSAPPHAAAKAAVAGRAEVRHYPCDHFDVLPGNSWFHAAVEHELLFLRRHLSERGGASR